jgi:nitrogen-specific signal transduction histidine kinase
LGLTVFVVLVVLAAGAEALLPRRNRVRPEATEHHQEEDLSFVLRSGLAPIRGYAEILGDRVDGDDDRRMIRAIEHHADRLTDLADRLNATSCSSSAASR